MGSDDDADKEIEEAVSLPFGSSQLHETWPWSSCYLPIPRVPASSRLPYPVCLSSCAFARLASIHFERFTRTGYGHIPRAWKSHSLDVDFATRRRPIHDRHTVPQPHLPPSSRYPRNHPHAHRKPPTPTLSISRPSSEHGWHLLFLENSLAARLYAIPRSHQEPVPPCRSLARALSR